MQDTRFFRLCLVFAMTLLTGARAYGSPGNAGASLDRLAEKYVRLVPAIGEYDANMVDAY